MSKEPYTDIGPPDPEQPTSPPDEVYISDREAELEDELAKAQERIAELEKLCRPWIDANGVYHRHNGTDYPSPDACPWCKLAAAREVLEFYANPETYHGVIFMIDSPDGGWTSDFEADHGHTDYDRNMPGKRARAALEGKS